MTFEINVLKPKIFAKSLKSEGESLYVKLWPENNSVVRSAKDVLRNSKRNYPPNWTVFFIFVFFNLILDAPRISHWEDLTPGSSIFNKRTKFEI